MSKLKHLVAVYGTLRKGMRNHRFLHDSEFILGGAFSGYEMRNLGVFPCVMHAPNDCIVHVELYHVSDNTLNNLDKLEGVPHLFKRRVLGTLDVGEGEQDIYLYIIEDESYRDDDKYPVIRDGDWVKYLNKLRQEKSNA